MTTPETQAANRAADRPHRPRNATASRAAILAAARDAFARDSYERVGVRAIAAAAGVAPALVLRYFGSKEQLFAEVLHREVQDLGLEAVLAGDHARLGERLARNVVREAAPTLLVTALRAAPDPRLAPQLRAAIADGIIDPIAGHLEGAHAVARATAISAQLLGLAVHYHVLRIQGEPLAAGEGDILVALVASALQSYVDGRNAVLIGGRAG